MVETRNKKTISQVELDCQKLNLLFKNRRKLKKTTTKKLNDTLLSIIYLVLYIFTFMLFISLFIGRVRYTYYESSEYLPLDFNSKHLLIDAVQRSRHKKLKKVENKFPTIKKFVKKNKYSEDSIVKNLIEKMCIDDADNPPKRILTTIIKQIKDNKIFDKALIPSLRQVCICIYI